ncbi:MAG: alpha-galactosidase [Opitutaceae bacterium]|nr:alpha-galactosidase [Opitutaceae bacterium]
MPAAYAARDGDEPPVVQGRAGTPARGTTRDAAGCLPVLLCVPALLIAFASAAAGTLDLGNGTRLAYTTPAPVLDGEKLPEPDFDADGRALVAGLRLTRTVTPCEGGFTLRLAVTNTRGTAIALRGLIPLQIHAQDNLLVAGARIPEWTVFRMARHKNDIPGPFRPTLRDEAAREAAADNSQGVHGEDDPDSPSGAAAVSYHADPGLVIIPDARPASAALFIGFDGQTEHLSDIALRLDQNLTALRTLTALAEFDGVTVPPGATRSTHALYIQTGADCDTLLRAHAARVAERRGSRSAANKNVFCTWYFYGPEITAADIRSDLAELKRRPVKFDTFLIDYNWDNRFGDWNPDTARFPGGMKAMADEIKAAGLLPGIWSCPFFLDPKSEALKRHPDLPLKNRKGGRITNKTMPFMEPCFVLDPTAPSAEAFLTELCRKFTGWGYGYLKFDFLRIVTLDENTAFHDRTMNRAQAYRRGLEILRRAAGERTMIGIWGGLYEASAGLVDIMRSGSDVRGHWDPLPGDLHSTRYPVRMRQTFARAFYDDILWTGDQDALQLRRRAFDRRWRSTRPHISMGNFTDEEAFSLVAYRFLGGGVVQVSEKLDEIDQDRYDLYKMVIPTRAPVARRFGGWTDYLPEKFASRFDGKKESGRMPLPPWSVVTLCNWNGNTAKALAFKPADVPDLPAAPVYAAFEFKTQTFLGVYKPDDTIVQDLPPHAARIIRLTPLDAPGRHLVGTDLSMTCGMEIQSFDGATPVLDPAFRDFPATFTLIDYKNGKAAITKTR